MIRSDRDLFFFVLSFACWLISQTQIDGSDRRREAAYHTLPLRANKIWPPLVGAVTMPTLASSVGGSIGDCMRA